MTETKESTISLLVNNKPDVMARIAGTFSGRGFNIETISVNVTKNPAISKIILTTRGDQDTVTKIEKQLARLVDVMQVSDLTKVKAARRELVLIRFRADEENRAKVMQAVDSLKGKIVDSDNRHFIIEVTADPDDIEKILSRLEPLGMEDFIRTGTVALEQSGT
jgi:acetolactate synthase-1/3 small subunit